jgi:hypothetical protein
MNSIVGASTRAMDILPATHMNRIIETVPTIAITAAKVSSLIR